ncbi:hypothetical protein PG984_011352 [Apiospora sp. TS-2023a]
MYGQNGVYYGGKKRPETNRSEFVQKLATFFDPYASSHEIKIQVDNFESIVDKAVELAYRMAAAKAHYVVRMGDSLYSEDYCGFNFDPSSMEIVDDIGVWKMDSNQPEPGTVALVKSPALLKLWSPEEGVYCEDSDAKGDGVFVKAQVIAKVAKKRKRLHDDS